MWYVCGMCGVSAGCWVPGEAGLNHPPAAQLCIPLINSEALAARSNSTSKIHTSLPISEEKS